jgi:predicted PurR-regulated permease PerM
LIATLVFHLVAALFAGMITFVLIRGLSALLVRHIAARRVQLVAVGLIAAVVVGGLALLVLAGISSLKSSAGLSGLLGKMAAIVADASRSLPDWIADSLPTEADDLRAIMVKWLVEHSTEMQMIGKEAGLLLAHVLVGTILGVLVALNQSGPLNALGPLALHLRTRMLRFGDAFQKVVFAQCRISAINTALTAVYLLIALPVLGIHLPFTKTILLLTFLLGLLPAIGNLLSNTVIVIVSLSHSYQVAVASLVFLVVVHKLEYFLNARIVGTQIRAHVWEVLLAMLLFETLFGLAGVVAAPVFYAYMKTELDARGLLIRKDAVAT